MTIKHEALAAIRWTTIAAVARGLFQIVQIAVLARLLLPEDYGLIAMVSVALTFAALLSDFGLSSAYVQRRDVTARQRTSLFWANLGLSVSVCILVVAISPFLARLFGDERLAPLLMLSATTLVLGALGQQMRMSAEKALTFRPLVLVEIGAAGLGLLVAVLTALAEFGAYALVFGSLVTSLASSVLAWIFIAGGWRPAGQFRLADIKPYLGFGGTMVGNNVINQISLSLDLLLGGRLLGATQLGLYSIPRNLILQVQFMVNPIITRVAFPLIAKVQHDLSLVRSRYLKTLVMTASTNAPLYVGLAFFADELVDVLLGKSWGGSVDFLRILAIWGFFRSTSNPVGSLLMGVGRPGLALRWNLALMLLTAPLLWLGARFGPNGLAWALLTVSVGLFIPAWYILVRPACGLRLADYLAATLKPMLLAISAIAPAYLLAVRADSALIRLVFGTAVAAALYVLFSHRYNKTWILTILILLGRSHRSPGMYR